MWALVIAVSILFGHPACEAGDSRYESARFKTSIRAWVTRRASELIRTFQLYWR